MDSDLSHEALERFAELEARIAVLENPGGVSEKSVSEEGTEVEEVPEEI